LRGLSPEVNFGFDDLEQCFIAEVKLLPGFYDAFRDF